MRFKKGTMLMLFDASSATGYAENFGKGILPVKISGYFYEDDDCKIFIHRKVKFDKKYEPHYMERWSILECNTGCGFWRDITLDSRTKCVSYFNENIKEKYMKYIQTPNFLSEVVRYKHVLKDYYSNKEN